MNTHSLYLQVSPHLRSLIKYDELFLTPLFKLARLTPNSSLLLYFLQNIKYVRLLFVTTWHTLYFGYVLPLLPACSSSFPPSFLQYTGSMQTSGMWEYLFILILPAPQLGPGTQQAPHEYLTNARQIFEDMMLKCSGLGMYKGMITVCFLEILIYFKSTT